MSEHQLDDTDRAIVNAFQGGFPVCRAPYEPAAAALQDHGVDLSPDELCLRIRGLVESGTLSRFGPLIDATALGGSTTLVAMAVPDERFEEVAEIVNGYREVAHNYERDHELNMWFVLSVVDQSRIPDVIDDIERETGLDAINLPKQTEFDLEAYFPVAGPLAETAIDLSSSGPPGRADENLKADEQCDSSSQRPHGTHWKTEAGGTPEPITTGKTTTTAEMDAMYEMNTTSVSARDVLVEIQDGLPLTRSPYGTVAEELGVSPDWVLRTIAAYFQDGRIRRIGVIPNHYALGYTENSMTVWDVPDTELKSVGTAVGALSFVTHSYERPRHGDRWPYNLFAMVHGRSPAEASQRVKQVRATISDHCNDVDSIVLNSTRILKKKGLRLQQVDE